MGLPLLVMATVGGKLLPKAGPWTDVVKAAFGVLLLGLAIYLLERVIPGPITMLLWASLLIVSAMYLGAFEAASTAWRKFWKGLGWLLFLQGILIMLGGSLGTVDPLKPLTGLTLSTASTAKIMTTTSSTHTSVKHSLFETVKTVGELEQKLATARNNNQAVVVDYYADWCVSCKEMEAETFSDAAVQTALAPMMLLRVDLTVNDRESDMLKQHFHVIAPPMLIFINKRGDVLNEATLVGKSSPATLLQQLKQYQL